VLHNNNNNNTRDGLFVIIMTTTTWAFRPKRWQRARGPWRSPSIKHYPPRRARRAHLKIPESRRLLCLPVSTTPSRRPCYITRWYTVSRRNTSVWRAPLNPETQTAGGSKINPTRFYFRVAAVRLTSLKRRQTRPRMPETSFGDEEQCV